MGIKGVNHCKINRTVRSDNNSGWNLRVYSEARLHALCQEQSRPRTQHNVGLPPTRKQKYPSIHD